MEGLLRDRRFRIALFGLEIALWLTSVVYIFSGPHLEYLVGSGALALIVLRTRRRTSVNRRWRWYSVD